jgi:hypothetical protein
VKTNVGRARRFPLFPNWTSLEARDAALATGMQKGMDSSFERLDAYLQKIS